MKTNSDPIFLDTSIAIARIVHSPEMKRRIEDRLTSHGGSFTSLVVKQEFKRRLLKEAQYLLNLLNDKSSIERVLRHIVDVLPPQQVRKRNICLEMLTVIFEDTSGEERTERAIRYLRQLLRVGLADFTSSVDQVIWESGCACSSFPLREKIPYKRYDFGPEKCSKASANCGIAYFFQNHTDQAEKILAMLRAMPPEDKTKELKQTEKFIENALNDPLSIYSMDPCLTVGDVLIALESAHINFFYTLNSKESQHLCRALNQSLIVRPKNPEYEDVVCLNSESDWPKF